MNGGVTGAQQHLASHRVTAPPQVKRPSLVPPRPRTRRRPARRMSPGHMLFYFALGYLGSLRVVCVSARVIDRPAFCCPVLLCMCVLVRISQRHHRRRRDAPRVARPRRCPQRPLRPHRSAALPSFVDVGVLWGTTAGAPSSGESAASQPQDSLLACRGVGLVVLALKQSFVKDAPLCVCRSPRPFRWRHARNSIKSPCAATHRRRTGWRRWRSRRPDTKAPGTAPMRALGLHLRLATTAHLSDAGILWR